MDGKTVAVTGANGFVASYLVKELLHSGYTVRGTVRNPDDVAKVQHLWALPGAKERLTLHKASLLEKGSFDSVVDGVDCVFHVASPVIHYNITDPQAQLIDPAIEGTLNLLQAAAKSESVKRVVFTSSAATVMMNRNPILPGTVVDEDCWSDPEYLREIKEWYSLSKTLAEMAAWDFFKENKHFDLVVIICSLVIGIPLQPTIDTGSAFLLSFLTGGIHYDLLPMVDAGDVARAHILAFEKPEAKGRYLLAEQTIHVPKLAQLLHKRYPEFPPPTQYASDANGDPKLPIIFSTKKAQSLCLEFRPIWDSIDEVVENFKEKGLLVKSS